MGKGVLYMKRFTAGAVAVVVFFACIVTAAVTGGFDKNLTVISIDVNPSIELTVDVDGKIDKAIGINAEAQALIDTLEIKGLDVDAAMDLIIGALVEKNYISEIANSILISVSNDKTEIAEEYEKLVVDAINRILEPLDTDINIISQIIGEQPDNITKLAEDLGISEGKAKFITDLVAENKHLSIKDLADMSINDISILINSNAITTPEGLEITGQANASAYISKPEALAAVLKKLDIPVEEIVAADVSFNYKDGAMTFDVTFIYGETEYNVSMRKQQVFSRS